MRELGYSERWTKLEDEEHTTFRYTRKDKDWQVGEVVKEVYRPRSKEREVLQPAEIIGKEPRCFSDPGDWQLAIPAITDAEAIEDGFPGGVPGMIAFMRKKYGKKFDIAEPINKLTLRVVNQEGTGGYREARGVLPWTPNSELPEDTLRRMRGEG